MFELIWLCSGEPHCPEPVLHTYPLIEMCERAGRRGGTMNKAARPNPLPAFRCTEINKGQFGPVGEPLYSVKLIFGVSDTLIESRYLPNNSTRSVCHVAGKRAVEAGLASGKGLMWMNYECIPAGSF